MGGKCVIARPCRPDPAAVTIPTTAENLCIASKQCEVICAIESIPASKHYITHIKGFEGVWRTPEADEKTAPRKRSRHVSGCVPLLRAVAGEPPPRVIRSEALSPSVVRNPYGVVMGLSAGEPAPLQEPARRL